MFQNLGHKKPKNPELFSITGMGFIQEKVKPLRKGGRVGFYTRPSMSGNKWIVVSDDLSHCS
jgi:hypothetical protein